MLEITDAAVNRLKKVLLNSGVKDFGIRIFASECGCCPSYGLDAAEKGEEGDVLVEKDSLKIYLDPVAYTALASATLDYRDGFTISGVPSCQG